MSNDPNKALVNAVHAVANAHLKAAANTIRQASNASGYQKNALINQLRAELAAAKQSSTAATNLKPSMPVQPGTAALVTKANNAVARNNQRGPAAPPPLPPKPRTDPFSGQPY
jgi:hypothetical protein